MAGPASLIGAAQSLATMSLAPRSAPWVPVRGAPVSCRRIVGRGVAREGQASRWRAPRLKVGARGCPPARLPAHSPIEVTPSGSPAKAGLGVATWGKGPWGGPRD